MSLLSFKGLVTWGCLANVPKRAHRFDLARASSPKRPHLKQEPPHSRSTPPSTKAGWKPGPLAVTSANESGGA